MMKSEMCVELVLPKSKALSSQFEKVAQERLFAYKMFSAAFNYPDDTFLSFFPEENKEKLLPEYDSLFRANEIWLYSTEYLAENEFQRANFLADISGFYRAFGLEIDKERPDFLATELEFMHFLIFKQMYALCRNINDSKEKAAICLDAQKKFFNTYIYPSAKRIAQKVIGKSKAGFYKRKAIEMLEFLELEMKYMEKKK
ncbi:MAG: molecular chaperone TorD family protein [Candidatus Omnitrophota bacterium]